MATLLTARVHGTFLDKAGDLGVADSSGKVLGQVNPELTLAVGNVASTCHQLRLDLAATDAEVLQTSVHFDKEVAGFDSRDGTIPKALGVLVRGRTAAARENDVS